MVLAAAGGAGVPWSLLQPFVPVPSPALVWSASQERGHFRANKTATYFDVSVFISLLA